MERIASGPGQDEDDDRQDGQGHQRLNQPRQDEAEHRRPCLRPYFDEASSSMKKSYMTVPMVHFPSFLDAA